MDHIVLDESGTLVSGRFYEFYGVDDDIFDLARDRDDSWIVVPRAPTTRVVGERDEPAWVRVTTMGGTTTYDRNCSTDKKHYKEFLKNPTEVDVDSGSQVSDFVADSAFQIVVSEPFKNRYEKSGLTGLKFLSLEPANEVSSQLNTRLYVLRFLGAHCKRGPMLQGAANVCPFCGYGPLICPDCDFRMVDCKRCGKLTAIWYKVHEGKNDQRLRLNYEPQAGPIFEGKKWEGLDFARPSFMTKRALDWLLSTHAAPFVARPARVCIDGMSKQQLEWLDRAKQPLPVMK